MLYWIGHACTFKMFNYLFLHLQDSWANFSLFKVMATRQCMMGRIRNCVARVSTVLLNKTGRVLCSCAKYCAITRHSYSPILACHWGLKMAPIYKNTFLWQINAIYFCHHISEWYVWTTWNLLSPHDHILWSTLATSNYSVMGHIAHKIRTTVFTDISLNDIY